MAGHQPSRYVDRWFCVLRLTAIFAFLLIGCGGTSHQSPAPPASPVASITLQMVSLSTTGVVANRSSSAVSVSDTGRFVFFLSAADNLAPADTHNTGIFVRDTCIGVNDCLPSTTPVRLLSLNPAAINGFTLLQASKATRDGRYIAFSYQNKLAPGLTADALLPVLVVQDTCTGVASCTPREATVATLHSLPPPTLNAFPSLSTNGRFVVYVDVGTTPLMTVETDTCLGEANCTPSTSLVSVSDNGTPADGDSGASGSDTTAVTPDGRLIAFSSTATNLEPPWGGGGVVFYVYIRDTCRDLSPLACIPHTRIWSRDFHAFGPAPGNTPAMSADARFLAWFDYYYFPPNHGSVSALDTCRNVFFPDTCPSLSLRGVGFGLDSGASSPGPSLSASGRFVAFRLSRAFDVADTCLGVVNCDRVTKQMPIAADGTTLNVAAFEEDLSGDGKSAVFDSSAPNIDPAHPNQNGLPQAYLGPTSF